MVLADSTHRFSSRVKDYLRYRPGYPAEVLRTLQSDCGLTPSSVVADVGSGTGLLAKLFLENGNAVYGIEPNVEMREAGRRLLEEWSKFRSVPGTAETTTLADHCVNFVTAGQAAHWFDVEKARREFLRILKPGGWLVLVWNDRATDASLLLQAYEQLLRMHCPEYLEVRQVDAATASNIKKFFTPAAMCTKTFPNQQIFDFTGLQGRLLSSSYAPQEGHPNHAPMLAGLRRIFEQFQESGRVVFPYETKMYYGQMA